MKKFILLLALLFVGCSREQRFVEVYNESAPKTVMIYTASGAGAGVYITERGHILTAAHLFMHSTSTLCEVSDFYENSYPGVLLYQDKNKDLALIKINEQTPYITLANEVLVGEEVLAIGNPLLLDFSASHGIVSAVNRELGFYVNLTQTDTMINPGNSGGPLINLNGELVGINNLIRPVVPNLPINSGLSFCVSSSDIKKFLSDLKGL